MPKTAKPQTKTEILNELLSRQRQWAAKITRDMHYPDYTLRREDNLFGNRLSAETQKDFERGSGGEFNSRNTKRTQAAPPKFHALKSSSALVCNVFDHWRNGGEDVLCRALDCGQHRGWKMSMEAQFNNGVSVRPCNLDVALVADDGWVLAIEAKFTEPLSRKIPLKTEYLPTLPAATPWAVEGLKDCDKLARSLSLDEASWTYLDVPQLLKHILGLHRSRKQTAVALGPVRDRYRLLYLYYDLSGDVGKSHKREIERFNEAVHHDVDFDSLSYQELITRLKGLTEEPDHQDYFDYLKARYDLG